MGKIMLTSEYSQTTPVGTFLDELEHQGYTGSEGLIDEVKPVASDLHPQRQG